jgi:hypothetical protein
VFLLSADVQRSLALPPGSTFVSVEKFGTSVWTLTGRLLARGVDGSEKAYFLKVCCMGTCDPR